MANLGTIPSVAQQLAARRAVLGPQADVMASLSQGFQQGQLLQDLPQAIQRQQQAQALQQLQQQLAVQKANTQIEELQNPELALQRRISEAVAIQQAKPIEVGGSLFQFDPVTKQYKNIFTAPTQNKPIEVGAGSSVIVPDPSSPSGYKSVFTAPGRTAQERAAQFVGFAEDGKPLIFDPGKAELRLGESPAGVSGPVLPKTQPAPRKSLLLENEKTGEITFQTLQDKESIPEGFREKAPTASNVRSVDSFRKEVASNPVVKQFRDVNQSKQRIDAAIDESKKTNNFVVVDQVLISTFNRLLEPDSVTMVSEYARTTADAPIINRIRANIARISEGGRLSQEERDAILKMSESIYGKSLTNYTNTIDFFQDTALRRGWDPRDIFQPLTGTEVSSPVATPGINPVAPAPVSSGNTFRIIQ